MKYGIDCTELKDIVGIENKRKYFKKILDKYVRIGVTKKVGSHYTFNGIVNFDQLQNLERLERLKIINNIKSTKGNFDVENIESKGDITNYNKSYDEIDIKPNSVIYCDIPYRNTCTYNEDAFDYDKFYNWALNQTQPTFISEYEMPNDFVCIAEKNKLSSMSATSNSTKTVERIFVPKHQHDKYKHTVEQLNLF